MASGIECITLDDSDDDRAEVPPALQYQQPPPPPARQEQMTRCNFCVDPGLLPVETDRAEHRSHSVGMFLTVLTLYFLGGKSTPTSSSTATSAAQETKATEDLKNLLTW